MTEKQAQKVVEWSGDEYHKNSDLQYRYGIMLLDTISLKGNELLVDAGCGSGRITKEILKRLPDGGIIGIDISNDQLQTARREVQPLAKQEAQFICASILDMDTRNLQQLLPANSKLRQKVDIIYSNMCVHFIRDRSKLYKNFASMLVPGGFIKLQFSLRPAHPGILRLTTMLKSTPYNKYNVDIAAFDVQFVDEATNRKALEDAGFVDLDIKLVTHTPTPEEREKIQSFLKRTVVKVVADGLPAELRENWEDAASNNLNPEGHFVHEFLNITAFMPPA